LWGPCREAAASPQGASGPVGDGGGEPGVRKLRQDAAVRLSPARQGRGSSLEGCPRSPCQHPWLTGTQRTGCCQRSGTRTSPSSWRPQSPPPGCFHAEPSAPQPCPPAQPRSPPATHPEGTHSWSRGNKSPHHPLPDAASRADGDLGCSSGSLRQQQSLASSPDTASLLSSAGSHSSEDRPPSSSHRGTEVRDLPPAQHPGQGRGTQVCLPTGPRLGPLTMASEPTSPCPVYGLVLAGYGGMAKSSFMMCLCTNEFRADVSSTLGVDFQVKQLLVDGEQTT
ncbi:RASEF protein, partial [Pandion haliaetus]|nr:RASEF protein [Pandion haliaetus]